MDWAPKRPVPVFPLPGVVLFPNGEMSLHVFELRYRTMVRDALSAQRLIVLAVLKPGWEREYHGSPEFHDLACLARIEDVEWLPNDCYDLHVSGLSRVRIGRPIREFPYRSARVELLPEAPVTEDDPLVQLERQALVRACEHWARRPAVPGESMAVPGPDRTLSYPALVNTACAGLVAEPAEKLRLLALDSFIERGRAVRERIERQLRERPAPPPPLSGEWN
jgi:Lon protease-like protein